MVILANRIREFPLPFFYVRIIKMKLLFIIFWVLLGALMFFTAVRRRISKGWVVLALVTWGMVLVTFMYFFYAQKDTYNFLFLDDDDFVNADPEIYCGDNPVLPEGYDTMGTRYRCLKKGIGAGMMLPDERRDEFLARPRPPPGPRIYCGNEAVLPAGYARFGLKSECLRKGVGTGLAMSTEKREELQARDLRPPGKLEILSLAKRLRITTDDKTRAETVSAIADYMEGLANDMER